MDEWMRSDLGLPFILDVVDDGRRDLFYVVNFWCRLCMFLQNQFIISVS